jgi:hypothetical protein
MSRAGFVFPSRLVGERGVEHSNCLRTRFGLDRVEVEEEEQSFEVSCLAIRKLETQNQRYWFLKCLA